MKAHFDHRAAGTEESAWQDARFDALASLEIPDARVLVVGAHPDDETLGAGGLIATAAAGGVPVEVLIATDGEASHPSSPTHSPQRLASIRREEVTAAVAALGSSKPSFLGLPDGRLGEHRRQLATALRDHLDGVGLVVSTWAGDGHPDHEALARAVREEMAGRDGVRHWQYPIWLWHWATPSTGAPWSSLYRLDLAPAAMAAKNAAIGCHASQHGALSRHPGDEAILPAPILAHFQRSFEAFVVEPARPAADPVYFDDLYARCGDPWDLEHRFYERRKRDLIMAALPQSRFAKAFEPGCATGLLTECLAERCDSVLAVDSAAAAVEQARHRLAAAGHVRVERRRIPEQWPEEMFDLVVLSEIGYYCTDLDVLLARVEATLAPHGVVLACHWRHPAADHPQPARAVHDALATALRPLVQHVEEDLLLDVWSRTGESVARAEGIPL